MKKMKIKYVLTSPLSHIGEVSSVGSYFQTVNTAYGRIPVVTGNSIRGILRDKLAAHLLDALGIAVDKETFNVLFSGGNITGTAKNDVERAKLIRQHFPAISLLGGGLGSMMMQGSLLSGFVYPVCIESAEITGCPSDQSWHDMIDEMEFTRTDDSKNDKYSNRITDINEEKRAKASTQMRFSVQYLAVGTELVQEITLIDGATELEEAALYTALYQWFLCPVLGGMKAKGFGTFNAETDGIKVEYGKITVSPEVEEKIQIYNDFIVSDNSASWLPLLREGKDDGKRGN